MIVVDTSALLAILNNEPERDRFLDVIANDDRVMVSALTLYEAMLIAGVRRGPENLGDLAQILEVAEAEIVPFDTDQAKSAQTAYMRYGKGIHSAARLICAIAQLTRSLRASVCRCSLRATTSRRQILCQHKLS